MNDENDPRAEAAPPASVRRPARAHGAGGEDPGQGWSTIPPPPEADVPPVRHLPPPSLDLRHGEREAVDVETMRGLLQRAFTIMSHTPPPQAEGYRLVRVLGRSVSWLDVPSDPGNGYAVLGAHPRCDLVLANDADVWLRHLVAIVVQLEEGLGLRLIDLRTDLPFVFDDGTPRRSALVRGQFAMRVGRHVVCGFPIAPSRAQSGALQQVATGAHGGATAVPHADSEASGSSCASACAEQVRITLSHLRSGSWWERASADVPHAEFDVGLMLGRAPGCFAGAPEMSSDGVSRPHLLLARERGHLYAFDLASTNGTRVNGAGIRRFRIPEAGARIELGKCLLVTLGRWSADAPPQGAA